MLTDILQEMGFDLPQTEADKPLVGLSACLAGEAVRYDGTDKRHSLLMDRLSALLRFQPLCPEVAAGMGVPRPPIQIVQLERELRVRGVADPQQDMTEALQQVAESVSAPLCGFVFKARSPSCGYLSTPVFSAAGEQIGLASGAFARRLHQRYPRMPVANDCDLDKPVFLDAFLLQIFCYQQWQRSQQKGQWLADMEKRSDVLDDPIYSGTRMYLDKLARAMN